ncbi:hypothetical protein BDZ85DRAFT_286529 [Elsinoe ampelina]|uniref:F-box domain-containing protein n=1 Tax=Elsinoe ampelina TaxID=302913 RepID=A0A6A6FYA6_9PEZI|nr:hypothetical protein BDZ85DRAFT_286529 [Elsinoe ampelina]
MAPERKRAVRSIQAQLADELEEKRIINPRKASLPPQYSASGRPIRRPSKNVKETAFADSTFAISDESSASEIEVETVTTAPSRKRKRTPPPALTPARLLETSARSTPTPPNAIDETSYSNSVPKLSTNPNQPFSLTFNIPLGFQGPLTINIDANDLIRSSQTQAPSLPVSQHAMPPTEKASVIRKTTEVTSRSLPGKVGFLDLPPEIRNEIYRATFIKDQRRFNFSTPSNFQRTTALLRTCRQAAHEGASMLYSESEFYFRRSTSSRTPLWTTDSKEIGFSDVHRFLKMIGPSNVARLRHVFFLLEDAVPCLNPQFKTAEERRYVHDEHLKAAIRLIADHGRLQTLKLGFFGRRNIAESDSNFLNEIKAIKADSVEVLARRCHPDWPRLYSNLQWPKIFFHLALDVKTAVTRKRKFYPPCALGKKDFFEEDTDEETREAKLCADCGDIHV